MEIQRRICYKPVRPGSGRHPEEHRDDVRPGNDDAFFGAGPPLPRDGCGPDLSIDGTQHEMRRRLLRALPIRTDLHLQGWTGVTL